MNKILNKVVFYGSALIVGGVIGFAITYPKVANLKTVENNLTQELKEIEEKPAKTTIPLENVNNPQSVEKHVEKSIVTSDKKQKTSDISTSDKAKKQQQLSDNSGDVTSIYTYEDYEKTILGTCPSERNKSNIWEEGNRLNAIGIITSGANPTSPMGSLNHYIETWWNSMKISGDTGRHMMANLTQVNGFDKTWSNSRVAFFIRGDGLFIEWDNSWEDGKSIDITDEQEAYLDHMVSDGTLYLRSLDAQYNAKCPNN